MNNTSLAIFLITLIFGAGIGYAAGYKSAPSITPEASEMDDAMHAMNEGLAGKTGDDFDKAFIEGMVVHHEGAVTMAEAALVNAKHEEIKNLATAIIEAQTSEIAQMKSWQAAWYGETDHTAH